MPTAAEILKSDALDVNNFLDSLSNAARIAGLATPEANRLFQRMKAANLVGVNKIAHFEAGILRVADGNGRAQAVDRLKQVLIGGGPGASPADTHELVTTLSALVDSCLDHYKTSREKKGPDAVDSSEEKSSKKGYRDLYRFQGKLVDLDSRLNSSQMGKMVIQVTQNDCLESIPGVQDVRYANRAGAQRQTTIGNMTDGSAVTVSVQGDGAVPLGIKSFGQVHHNLRALIYAITAALSRTITTTAYGGGDSGIVSVPGEGRQVRVQLDLDTAERLIWRLVSATAEFTSLGAYVDMIDLVLYEFVKQCEPLKMHPSEVIMLMLGTTPALFKPAPRAADAPAASPAAPAADPGALAINAYGGPPNNGTAVCHHWLTNGNCRKYVDGTCPSGHPAKMQGALRGGGRATPYPAWGGWGGGGGQWADNEVARSWDASQHWNPNQGGWGGGGKWKEWNQGGGKGGGKGAGGKGGGKGKGKKGKGKGKW